MSQLQRRCTLNRDLVWEKNPKEAHDKKPRCIWLKIERRIRGAFSHEAGPIRSPSGISTKKSCESNERGTKCYGCRYFSWFTKILWHFFDTLACLLKTERRSSPTWKISLRPAWRGPRSLGYAEFVTPLHLFCTWGQSIFIKRADKLFWIILHFTILSRFYAVRGPFREFLRN